MQMESIFNTYKPNNFHTIVPYLFVNDPLLLIEFLTKAFSAKEINRSINPSNGDIANCILQVGDTCIMISQARGQYKEMKTALYLFVDDVDAIHQRAISYGAKIEFEPADMSYEDRQSGIVDPCGNYWWISASIDEGSSQ